MKKSLLLITLGILVVLCISGCQPLEVSAYCLTSFDQFKEQYPDLSESYIGFCISSLQSGEFREHHEICENKSTWSVIGLGWFGTAAEINSADECNLYFDDLSLLLPAP